MPLTQDEIFRYAPQIVLPEIGGAGQQKLKKARVLIVGLGGLGCPVLVYLAGMGVGTLGLADSDQVSLSNLQRQFLYPTDSIGTCKTKQAASLIQARNPHVEIRSHALRLTEENASTLVESYSCVVDACDNFETRLLLSEACFRARKPLISAAVQGWQGLLTLLKPYEKDPEGRSYPSYRDLFPQPPAASAAPCQQLGIVGAVAGVLGSLQAVETLKEIIGIQPTLLGFLLLYDARTQRLCKICCMPETDSPSETKNVPPIPPHHSQQPL